MKAVLAVFGVLAAVVAGVVALFLLGELAALLVLVVLLALTVWGLVAERRVTRAATAVVVVALLGAAGIAAWQGLVVFSALTGTEGPVDPADAAALASARDKLDSAAGAGGFRIVLTEVEMTAYVLEALADNPDNPLRRVDIDVTGEGEEGQVEFVAAFKSGDLTAKGAVTATLDAGAVEMDLVDVDVGAMTVPDIAEGALEDLIESVADLNEALADAGASVQAISVGDDAITVVGTTATTDLLTSEALLASLQEQVAAAGSAVTPPPEQIGPGDVNGTSADGPSYYVALGDSLAANVGVAEPRDGYVSRFHKAVQARDGASYGLRNYAVSGETTGSLIRGGQLDQAVAFMGGRGVVGSGSDVSYITIDIGANNLLGHLGSDDCQAGLETPACRARLDSAFDGYDDDLATIFDALTDAAPEATIIFLEAYNPFSLGFSGVGFEADSNRIVSDFNAIGREVAEERGLLVADGFTPMVGTTAATTHMLDSPPDIHPLPVGYDILAVALLDALG